MDDLHLYPNLDRRDFIDQVSTALPSDDDDASDLPDFEVYFGAEMDEVCWATCEATQEDDDDEDSPPVIEFDRRPQTGENVRPLSRKEQKALDREIPWRELLRKDRATRDASIKAIHKEADAWAKWSPVRPLSKLEAAEVLRSRILVKRILRSRMACGENMSVGYLFLAKARLVATGFTDPDLHRLTRNSPTATRLAMFVVLQYASSGLAAGTSP